MTVGSAQLPLDLPHRASFEREDLVVAGSNEAAVGAVDAWPRWPHPILVIVGPPSSGKSHLAKVWARKANAVDVRSGANGFAATDAPFAVVADDLDRGDLDENRLFGLLNAARLGGGTMLATARAMPGALPFALPDLRSRLRAASVAELGAPTDELLMGVLAKLFADRQVAVEPRLLDFAVARMERSPEAALRFVARLDRRALAAKKKVSRARGQEVLEEIDAENRV